MTERKMSEVPIEERKQILLDMQVMKSREVREKWNISKNTLGHIKWNHGRSSAKARGYYHKPLVENVFDPLVNDVRELKAKGYTSGQIAKTLKKDLAIVNRIWTDLLSNEI